MEFQTDARKTCKRCGESKSINDFVKCARNKDGRYYLCKICGSIKHPRELKYLPSSVQPTPQQAAWAAGFIDAEGSFVIMSAGMQFPALAIYNNNPEPLRVLHAFLGGALQEVKRKKRAEHHKTGYALRMQNQAVLKDACKKIRPYLLLKGPQCDLAVQACDTERQDRGPLIEKIKELNNAADIYVEEMKVTGHRVDLELVSDFSWHYLAGYIEGDGCFSFRPWDADGRNKYWYPMISVYSARYASMKWINETFGGNLKWRGRTSDQWEPECSAVFDDTKHVEQMLKKLIPCLVCKKKEAEILLDSLQVESRFREEFAEKLEALRGESELS